MGQIFRPVTKNAYLWAEKVFYYNREKLKLGMISVQGDRVGELIKLSERFKKLTFKQKLELMDEDIRVLRKAHGGKSPKEILQLVEDIKKGRA